MRKMIIILLLTLGIIEGTVSSSVPPSLFSEEFDELSWLSPLNEVKPYYRLDQSVKPIHYALEIRPILEESEGEARFTCPGKVDIKISTNDTGVSKITLHRHNETVSILESMTKVTKVSDGEEIDVIAHSYDEEKQFYSIELMKPLDPMSEYLLHIDFITVIAHPITWGLYLSSYKDSNGLERFLATTDFQPTDARRAWPCFDEPQLKATWELSIIRLPEYHSLANMRRRSIERDIPGLPNWIKDIYEVSVPMSSYLVCIAVSDFMPQEAAPGLYRSPVTMWAPSRLIEQGGALYSADLSAKLLTALEIYFNIPYPIEKMDKINVPDFHSGAMENYGLNTYREPRLIYIQGITNMADKVASSVTISHELVHQWFGDYMTMTWWDDFWLSEGFATYYSYVGLDLVGPDATDGQDLRPMEMLITDAVQRAMQDDVKPSSHPMKYQSLTKDGLTVQYSRIVYQKSASVLRQINFIFGESVVKEALNNFLKEFAFADAVQDDLFRNLQSIVDQNPSQNPLPDGVTVQGLMETWTLQTSFPLLTVVRDAETGEITVTQRKFSVDETQSASEDAWYIPVVMMNSTGHPEINGWLRNSTSSGLVIPAKASSLLSNMIVNPRQIIYARTNYDDATWDHIIDSIIADSSVVDRETRSGLMDDALNLAFQGEMNLTKAMIFTEYLKSERSNLPWTSFFNSMHVAYRMLSRSPNIDIFGGYVINLLSDAMSDIGMEYVPSEPVIDVTLLRTKLFSWLCDAGHDDSIQYALAKFSEWKANPGRPSLVFPDLQAQVYCTAIEKGTDEDWDFVLDQYVKTDREFSRLNLLRALGCSQNDAKLEQLMNMAIDMSSPIKDKDRVIAMQSLASNTLGIDIALQFVQNYFNDLLKNLGVGAYGSLMSTLSTYMNTPDELVQFQQLRRSNLERLEPISKSLDLSEWTILQNIKWINQNNEELVAYLNRSAERR